MENIVSIIKDPMLVYPDSPLFHPSIAFPEYKFPDNLSKSSNKVYEKAREIFLSLGLDKDNYGDKSWNPLGELNFPRR